MVKISFSMPILRSFMPFQYLKAHLAGVEVNPWTLSFKDDVLEALYWERRLERDMPICVLYLLLGVVLYVGFIFLDMYLMSGRELTNVLVVRGITCCLIATLSVACAIPRMQRYLQWVLSLNLFVAGVGIIVMTTITAEPVRHLYYSGLLLVLIFMPYVNLFRFNYSAPTSTSLVAIYVLCVWFVAPIDAPTMANNITFLLATNMFSVWANYWNDFNSRSEFVQYYQLMEEKRQSDVLRKKAEAGSHAKSEFLAVVSHELRTPLNAIIGFADIIRKKMFGPIGNDKYEEYIHDIVKSGNHLLNIINNILDLSKAEAGKLELREDYVSIAAILDDVMLLSRQQAYQKDLNVRVDLPYEDVIISADPRHLRLMIANLMSNAVKFTENGGEIAVVVRVLDSKDVVIRVSDTGVGIAADDIAKVLEPFVQVESAMSRYHEGTGLGLPLVKQFADLHEADLSIESQPGVGTTVQVRFPARRFLESLPAREDPMAAPAPASFAAGE